MKFFCNISNCLRAGNPRFINPSKRVGMETGAKSKALAHLPSAALGCPLPMLVK